MKKSFMLVLAVAFCVFATSCSHNASLVGVGTSFRIGSGEFSVNYADGLFLNLVSRENVRFGAELDSSMGVTYDPTTGTYKGIKGIQLEIGPQVTGYATEMAEVNPEALKSYYDALGKYYEYRGSHPLLQTSITDEKSTAAIKGVIDAVKDAVANRADSEESKDGGEEDACETCSDVPEEEEK